MSETLDATRRELDEAGIPHEVIKRGKHYKVRFRICGKPYQVVCSRSTSDRRAKLNARLLVRRVIRRGLENGE